MISIFWISYILITSGRKFRDISPTNLPLTDGPAAAARWRHDVMWSSAFCACACGADRFSPAAAAAAEATDDWFACGVGHPLATPHIRATAAPGARTGTASAVRLAPVSLAAGRATPRTAPPCHGDNMYVCMSCRFSIAVRLCRLAPKMLAAAQ